MLALVALLLTAEPRPQRTYLLAREGKQCSLRAVSAVAAEKERLRPAVAEIWVSYALELLPAACIPKDRKPFQKAPTGCESCGCPQTWFFCAQSAAGPAALRTLGYTPVGG